MAKFCGYCGSKMEDNQRACGQCGKIINESLNVNTVTTKIHRKKFKVFNKVSILILFLALIIIIIANLFVGKKAIIRKTVNAIENNDTAQLENLCCDIVKRISRIDNDDSHINVKDSVMRYFDNNVGKNYKISYEIDEIYDLSNREHTTLLNEIDEWYNADTKKIKNSAIAYVVLTARSGNKSDTYSIEILMVKEGFSWKLFYIDDDFI